MKSLNPCLQLVTTLWIHLYYVVVVFADFGAPLNYQVLPLGLAYNQFPNGTLLISSVDKASKGAYTCTAQNGIRSAISKTINVTVNGMWMCLVISEKKNTREYL